MAEFDPEAHEAQVSENYRRLAVYETFDRFIDLALDGQITLPEALAGFKEECAPDLQPPT